MLSCPTLPFAKLSGITPLIQQNLVESSGVEKNTALAIGALSGAILAGTITHPMDTIKTCMQAGLAAASRPAGTTATATTPLTTSSTTAPTASLTTSPSSLIAAAAHLHLLAVPQGDLGQEKYKGIMQTGRLLAEEYGVMQGLFKGLSYRIALISTTFFLVNSFKQRLVPFMFPHVGWWKVHPVGGRRPIGLPGPYEGAGRSHATRSAT